MESHGAPPALRPASFRVPFGAAIVAQGALYWLRGAPWLIAIRPLPMLALAVAVARAVPVRRAWLVVLGLVLGGAGDAAMSLRRGATSQLPLFIGMGLFLAGHLCYSVTFFREREYRPRRVAWAASLFALALAVLSFLAPRLGDLAVPVAVYALSLVAMTALAALRRSPSATVMVGALLFFVSDALIGARLGGVGVPGPVVALVLPTYYLGQYWIAAGWARDAAKA